MRIGSLLAKIVQLIGLSLDCSVEPKLKCIYAQSTDIVPLPFKEAQFMPFQQLIFKIIQFDCIGKIRDIEIR